MYLLPADMDMSWITASPTDILMVVLSALVVYAVLVLFTRMVGLRSFSKMSSFDFAITVAFGAILASTAIAEDPPIAQAIAGLAVLYVLQYTVSIARRRMEFFAWAVDNEPLLIMAGETVLEDNLAKAQMTRADLRGKLREANVIHPNQVRAVVMEATGDVSVLHADPDGPELDHDLLAGVRGVERLKADSVN